MLSCSYSSIHRSAYTLGVALLLLLLLPAARAADRRIDALAGLDAPLKELHEAGFATTPLRQSLTLLTTTIHQQQASLPQDLHVEVANSIAARLELLQAETRQYLASDYRAALIATRVLEITENLAMLKHRSFPSDPAQRARAASQYKSLADELKAMVQTRATEVNPNAIAQVTDLLGPELAWVQSDVFRPGYGRPVDPSQQQELRKILTTAVDDIARLAKTIGKDNYSMTHQRQANAIAIRAADSFRAFLHTREENSDNNLVLREDIEQWHKQNKPTESLVLAALDTSEKRELELLSAKRQTDREQMLRENDPGMIQMRVDAEETMRQIAQFDSLAQSGFAQPANAAKSPLRPAALSVPHAAPAPSPTTSDLRPQSAHTTRAPIFALLSCGVLAVLFIAAAVLYVSNRRHKHALS